MKIIDTNELAQLQTSLSPRDCMKCTQGSYLHFLFPGGTDKSQYLEGATIGYYGVDIKDVTATSSKWSNR